MMTRTFDPFVELEAVSRDMERLFGLPVFRNRPFRTAFLPGAAARAYPLMNVGEDPHGYVVEALAPGLDPAKLQISVLRNQLTVAGEKTRPNGDIPADAFHRSERAAGRFVRTIQLGTEIDADKVTAEYRHGLLRIALPKADSARPRQIAVSLN
ncbi:MAG: Hsp20/alpha crystallin family protein [Candidatus Sumerlaeia bacterium]|nr:Hsp20/alpha crystallin family protein [Candidatus Sumerlaeia bacterium]